jgi:molecular chaperone DnaK (HSP70)
MNISDKKYIIGIDLGTTNSAVSYVDLSSDAGGNKRRINIFHMPQLTGAGEVSSLPVLPSFLYIPGPYDISDEALVLPWKKEIRTDEDKNFVGAFARDHGAKIPSRLVSSAKSWLCHAKADRLAPILPWGASDDIRKISPVSATAAYLSHMRYAWNSSRKDEDELYFENQMIVLTVPASFDEVARELTLTAAKMAGLTNVTLLEEPLAAFYSWLIVHEDDWRRYVAPGALILVCDVGGGTTDFTLISLEETEFSPRFERIAVGDHLILGGDNIDLALAGLIEKRVGRKTLSLTADRWKMLCHQCRQAKEEILDGHTDTKAITLMGEGSRLIADTVSATLSREDVERTVVEGFFPFAAPGKTSETAARKGITEFGLPYEYEPSITRHLGQFLDRHKKDVIACLNKKNALPDLILFNGGSLKAPVIRKRICLALNRWFQKEDGNLPEILDNPVPDLAVALGAAYYGLVKTGQGVRVGSGSPRAFYLGIDKHVDDEKAQPVPAAPADAKKYAVCLVERGLEEGSRIQLAGNQFDVLTNRPVSFDIYSSSFRAGDRCGDLIEIDDSLTPLAPLHTVIQFGKKGSRTDIPIDIEAGYTEIGTLAVWCRSLTSNHRWKLGFKLRDTAAFINVKETEIFDDALIERVSKEIHAVFAAPTDKENGKFVDALVKTVASIVKRDKTRWPLSLIRHMADTLLEEMDVRTKSPLFESRWLNLAGFCLRPGFGESFDDLRVKKLWKIHGQGPAFPKHLQVRSEWWILWRRVAGGLTAGQQRQFVQEITPLLMPKKDKKIKLPPQEQLEIWMALANMEHLMAKEKTKWGGHLLSMLRPKKTKPQYFWALARLGARELLYGPVDRVTPAGVVSAWITTVLAQNWRNPVPVGAMLAQLARKTGDRIRDLDPAVIGRVTAWMSHHGIAAEHMRLLSEVVPMAQQEESTIFGESLPSGIVLRS